MKFLKQFYFLMALAALVAACNDDDNDVDLTNSDLTAPILSGGPFDFIVDGEMDNIPEGGITVDNAGTELDATGWIVTDEEGLILGLPDSFTGPDFDEAGSGTCLVWYITYGEGLVGLETGVNVSGLDGLYALSNAIVVNRLDAPTLSGGPFAFTVSDGEADSFEEGDITVEGGFAPENQSSWVITDDQGTILGLPGMITAPDFDEAGEGVCLVYYIAYGSNLTGLAEQGNLEDLNGVYELSNGLEINRLLAPELSGGPFDFIVDGEADNLAEGDITVESTGTELDASGWVVTDTEGLILGLPDSFTGPDFDEAGSGTCLVWYITYKEDLTGLEMNGNTSELAGVFALSNSVYVNRLDAPILSGGPFEFTVGDGIADNLMEGDITVTGGYALEGQSSWVVTDDATGDILGLPDSFTDVNFDGAGVGVCNIYYITYGEGLTGLTADGGNIGELNGTYELSNAITINRN